jgi:hypothetical protein
MMVGKPEAKRSERSLGQRVEAGLLLSAILLGCQVLWLVLPGAALWLLSRFVRAPDTYLLAALVLLPTAVGGFAFLLTLANRRFLQITRPAAEEEDEEEVGRLYGPLESILPGSIIVAIGALIIWLAFFADQLAPEIGSW